MYNTTVLAIALAYTLLSFGGVLFPLLVVSQVSSLVLSPHMQGQARQSSKVQFEL